MGDCFQLMSNQMGISYQPGDWAWSLEHHKFCWIVNVQALWGKTVCRVWLPGKDTVVRLSSTCLRPVQEARGGTVDEIAYLAAAARKIPENVLQEDPKLLMCVRSGALPNWGGWMKKGVTTDACT